MKQPLQFRSLFAALMLFLVSLGASAQQPVPFPINIFATDAQCAGTGALAFSITTGLIPGATITYTVYSGTGTGGSVVGVVTTPPYQLQNLVAGTYTVQATQTLLGVVSLSQAVTVVVGSTTAVPTYSPLIVGVRCVNDGYVVINTVTGVASQYALLSSTGQVLVNYQNTNRFDNLGIGSYTVRVRDICGNLQDITVNIVQETTNVTVGPYVWPYKDPQLDPTYYELDSCNTIRVLQSMFTTAPQIIFFPLTLTYSVTNPTNGQVTVVTQTVAQGTGQTPLQVAEIVSAPLPFYHAQQYEYDLLVTDACGNTFSRNDNVINETFGIQAEPSYGQCDEAVNIVLQNYVAPYTVRFVSFTAIPDDPGATFDIVNDPINHNPLHPTFPSGTNPLSYANHLPTGNYCIEITDACGRIANVCFEINPPVQSLSLSGDVPCGATTGSLIAEWTRSPTNFATAPPYVRIVPPYPPGALFDTTQPFIDISGGINPLNPAQFTWPGLALGDYIVEAKNECKDTIYRDTVTLTPNGVPMQIAYLNRPGCTDGYGSVTVNGLPDQPAPPPILGARIISSDSPVWTAANPAPVDITSNIAANGRLYINGLPEGNYVFEITDGCGPVNHPIEVIGYHATRKTATVARDCVTFTVTIDVAGDNPGTTPFYYLQKLDPVTGNWVHPVTGTVYVAGDTPVGSLPSVTPGAGDTAVRLVGPSLNAQGVLVPGVTPSSGNGTFRVIEAYSVYGNGIASGQRCITTMATFVQGGAPVIDSIVSFPCSASSGEAIVVASGITNAAFPNLLYSVTAPGGQPSTPQTSNVFANLLPNVAYNFTVRDACGTTNQTAQIQPQAALAITQTGSCVGQTLTLTIPEYSFLDYEWYNTADPATILSTTGTLAFTPYTNANAGTYAVRITNPTSPTSCLNGVLLQTITGSVLPEAGTPVTVASICTSVTAAPVDLTTYLTGANTGGTFTQSASTPGGVLTGNLFNISTITTSGTFTFIYSVADACGNSDTATITVTTTESPVAPTVNTLPVQCEGNAFNLTATSTTPGVTFEWTLPNGTVVTGATLPFTGLIAETGTYNVVAISADGVCRSAAVATTVTVVAAPNAGVGQTVSTCNPVAGSVETLGSATYLGATFDNGGVWADISATPVPASQFNAATGTLNTAGLFGQYQFTYTVSACGITSVATVTLNLNATPATPVITPATLIVCAGATVQIDTPAVTGATYTWTLPNSTTVLTNVPQLVINNADPAIHNGQYSLSVTVNNCPSIGGTATVTVTPLPLAGTAGTYTNCSAAAGPVVTLTSTLTSAFDTAATPNTASALWTLVSATTPLTTEFNAANGTFATANLVGTYVFNYTVTSTCGAVATANVTVTLNATPATPVITTVPFTVCEGNAIQLTTPLVAGATYTWYLGTTVVATSGSNQYNVAAAQVSNAGNYTVTITVNGCTSADSAPVNVIVAPRPQFTLPASAIVCPTQQLPITVTPVNNSFVPNAANITYTWYRDGVVQPQFTTNSITVTTTTDVIYSVEISNTNAGSCSTTQQIQLTIDTDPFTIVLDSECVNEHLILSVANLTDIGTTQSIVWTGPGSVSQTGNNAQLDITAANGTRGEYSVEITNADGCVKNQVIDIQSLNCFIPKGISPNGDEFNNNFDLTNLDVQNLQIFNRYGQQVYEKNNYTKEWYGQSDKGDLPTGTYFYVAKLPNGQVTGWVYLQKESK
jgi:gliding motility-associated-like protein